MCGSRHSILWEPRAAEPVPHPEEDTARDTSGLSPLSSPLASPQPSEEGTAGGALLGASRRPRISLCAVMRSISLLETPEPPGLLGEPLAGEVSRGQGGMGGSRCAMVAAWGDPTVPTQVFEATDEVGGPSPRSRPSSRPRGVVRQASLDGGPAPFCDHAHAPGHAQTEQTTP